MPEWDSVAEPITVEDWREKIAERMEEYVDLINFYRAEDDKIEVPKVDEIEDIQLLRTLENLVMEYSRSVRENRR